MVVAVAEVDYWMQSKAVVEVVAAVEMKEAIFLQQSKHVVAVETKGCSYALQHYYCHELCLLRMANRYCVSL